jgi:trehalose 6-phosphate synthase
MPSGQYDFVVVANRLPVDQVGVDDQGSPRYETSPGGLVTALAPIMRAQHGAWVGWPGVPGEVGDPFDSDDMHLVPVALSACEVENYYEGLANGTLWPLFHDVIAAPEYHRHWWDAYVEVNQRFAEAAAAQAADGATVWVQDYQLLLVPARIRELRPDLRIGFFNHIPFPGYEIFSQLPWRRQVVEGVLGADLVGFQRRSDATNFLRACRRAAQVTTKGQSVHVGGSAGPGERRAVKVSAFPISIDAKGFEALASSPDVVARAEQIRKELGEPDTILLGVDRLDYTKGIRHRLATFAELLEDGELGAGSTVLVQVASPSRERVQAYADLRDEIELMVGRLNGDHGSVGSQPVHYLHQSFPRDEMAALYLAADVMLVTALRDGMNLVAKEYVAARHDGDGVLVLSEFAGAADELTQAVLINPHDIDGTKAAILRAVRMPSDERRRRMRSLRRRVVEHDVERWAADFLGALAGRDVAHGAAADQGSSEPGTSR